MLLANVQTDNSKDYGITHARNKYNASIPATVDDGEGNQVANPDLIASDAAYLLTRLGNMIDSWAAQADIDNAPVPTPTPGVINGVPQAVTRRQGIQALINTGKLDSVSVAIAAVADPTTRATLQNEWDNSLMFERQRPSLMALALSPAPAGLGMTATELDNLFIYAATL